MIHFVNTKTNKVYGYKTIEEAKIYDNDFKNLKEITIEEANAIANPPLAQAKLDAQKEAENIAFLAYETRRTSDAIEILDDAIEFEEATDEEVAQHKSLRKYRLDLSRVPNQETWPLNPVWPICPEFFKTKE